VTGRGSSVAVLVAPYRRRTAEDTALLLAAKQWLVSRLGIAPVFFPDTLAGVLDDESPNERAEALRLSREFVRVMARNPECILVVAADRWTEGCDLDVAEWIGAGREPVHFWQLVSEVERRTGDARLWTGRGERLLRRPWRCLTCTGSVGQVDPDALRCPTCRAPVVPVREVADGR